MARLPNTATKQERREVHAAKMAGKVIDRVRRAQSESGGRTNLESMAQIKRVFGMGSIAGVNRHTGEPHTDAQAIARRQRQVERDGRNREARGIVLAAGHRFVHTRRNLMLTEGGTIRRAFAQ